MLQMPPRGRQRGRAVGRAPARRRRARTPPMLEHRSDLDSGSSDEERQPLQRARPPHQPAQEAQVPEQQAMPGPDPAPPILHPEPPTFDQKLDQMQLMLNMQNARIEVLLEARQPQIPAAQGMNPVQAPAYPQALQDYQRPLQVPAHDLYQQPGAQGFQFPPLQEQGESPLAPFLLLGSVVDNSLKAKIWEGRYVELASLGFSTPQPSLDVSWNGLKVFHLYVSSKSCTTFHLQRMARRISRIRYHHHRSASPRGCGPLYLHKQNR